MRSDTIRASAIFCGSAFSPTHNNKKEEKANKLLFFSKKQQYHLNI